MYLVLEKRVEFANGVLMCMLCFSVEWLSFLESGARSKACVHLLYVCLNGSPSWIRHDRHRSSVSGSYSGIEATYVGRCERPSR